jgi:serine phosphatase RsbU (regulator of sigma subunit)
VISNEKYYQEQLDSMQDMMERTTAYMEELQEELKEAKDKLKLKNEELLEGVNYAAKIQNLLLPDHDFFNRFFEDYYWHINQKDRIGGDFIYSKESESHVFIGLFDCTGHGMSGSLLSVMGHRLLDEAFLSEGVSSPSTLMRSLDDGFRQFFKIDANENKDGIQGVLFAIDKNNRKLTFCAAGRPMVIRLKGEWTVFESSSSIIGGENPDDFEDVEISFDKNDEVFIFSDGLVNQFGGDLDKAFHFDRVLSSLNNGKYETLSDRLANLETHYKMWLSGWDQTDDVSFLGVKLK